MNTCGNGRAVIGGWMVYDALSDPSIRPEKANDTTIQEKIDRIQKVMSSQKPPTRKPLVTSLR